MHSLVKNVCDFRSMILKMCSPFVSSNSHHFVRKGIAVANGHCCVGICAHPDFPDDFWDRLLPYAEITLNVLHPWRPNLVPLPACNASNKPSLSPPVLLPHIYAGDPTHLIRDKLIIPARRRMSVFKPFRVLHLFLPLFLPDFTFSSFLPSRRIA
jgi:hypothetical protein